MSCSRSSELSCRHQRYIRRHRYQPFHPFKKTRRQTRSYCQIRQSQGQDCHTKGKKQTRDFKFKDNSIFINEHLAPNNRKLFAVASEKNVSLHTSTYGRVMARYI